MATRRAPGTRGAGTKAAKAAKPAKPAEAKRAAKVPRSKGRKTAKKASAKKTAKNSAAKKTAARKIAQKPATKPAKNAAKAVTPKKAAKPAARGAVGGGLGHPEVRAIAMALPGVEEGVSYGTPAWRVRGKLFARMHQSEPALVVRIDLDDREVALAADPATYYITDHYRGYPMMLVHLGRVAPAALAEAVEASWRRVAPARLLAERETRS